MSNQAGDRQDGSQVEARVVRGDLAGLCKADLPTPCLVLDEAVFTRNLHTMAAHSRATGLAIRPHFKVHRCVAIARQQMALGAIGLGSGVGKVFKLQETSVTALADVAFEVGEVHAGATRLEETVIPCEPGTPGGNGFAFEEFTPEALSACLKNAVSCHSRPDCWSTW